MDLSSSLSNTDAQLSQNQGAGFPSKGDQQQPALGGGFDGKNNSQFKTQQKSQGFGGGEWDNGSLGQGGYKSSSSKSGSALGGALHLASQGLQTQAEQISCLCQKQLRP